MKRLFSAALVIFSLLGSTAMAEEAYVMQKIQDVQAMVDPCSVDSTDCLPGAICPIGYTENPKYCKRKGSHLPWKGWYRCGYACQEDGSDR